MIRQVGESIPAFRLLAFRCLCLASMLDSPPGGEYGGAVGEPRWGGGSLHVAGPGEAGDAGCVVTHTASPPLSGWKQKGLGGVLDGGDIRQTGQRLEEWGGVKCISGTALCRGVNTESTFTLSQIRASL